MRQVIFLREPGLQLNVMFCRSARASSSRRDLRSAPLRSAPPPLPSGSPPLGCPPRGPLSAAAALGSRPAAPGSPAAALVSLPPPLASLRARAASGNRSSCRAYAPSPNGSPAQAKRARQVAPPRPRIPVGVRLRQPRSLRRKTGLVPLLQRPRCGFSRPLRAGCQPGPAARRTPEAGVLGHSP